VRLTPAGALRLLGTQLRGLGNDAADGDQVLQWRTASLADAIGEFGDSGSLDRLHGVLRSVIQGARPCDLRLEQAASLLHSAESPGISKIAQRLGFTTRQLDRGFDRCFGISPKMLGRLARFQRAFALGMLGRRGGWAAVARRCGYADQAHLTREFREFAGQTPERMRAAFASGDV
jgi:AraC-like DNA-binding protein